LASGKKIYFLDEVVFTQKTLQSREYSAKGQNITVDRSKLYSGYWSVIATISMSNKVEQLYFHNKAINQIHFEKYLRELRKKAGVGKVYLFMD